MPRANMPSLLAIGFAAASGFTSVGFGAVYALVGLNNTPGSLHSGQRLLGITSRSVVTRQPHASQIHQRFVTRTATTSWLLQLARRFSVSALHVRHSNAVT
jgi:hypothetical protein